MVLHKSRADFIVFCVFFSLGSASALYVDVSSWAFLLTAFLLSKLTSYIGYPYVLFGFMNILANAFLLTTLAPSSVIFADGDCIIESNELLCIPNSLDNLT